MATRRELPADVAAAFDRVPEARDSFLALPADRQAAWLQWIDRARGRRARAGRIDEMIRRVLPSAAVAEEEVAEPAGPPPERYWWLWLLLLLLLVVGGLLAWYFLSRGNDKAVVPNVIGLREQQADIRIHDHGLEVLPRNGPSNRPPGVVFAEKPGAGTQLGKGQTVTIFVSNGAKPVVVPRVVGQTQGAAVQALTKVGLKPILQNVSSVKRAGIVVGQ
ncbi:MAG TPA: PASTA domain-containing protein, partial [Gaiellaceae bacterium]